MKVIVTKKGAELACNDWEEGQEITCHENIGNHFIEVGYATEPGKEAKTDSEEVKQSKTKKK